MKTENKFKNFSDKELLILHWWDNHSDFHYLSNEEWDWSDTEVQENEDFISASDNLSLQLLDEVVNRFSPCCCGTRHSFENGLLDSSRCVNCMLSMEEMLEQVEIGGL